MAYPFKFIENIPYKITKVIYIWWELFWIHLKSVNWNELLYTFISVYVYVCVFLNRVNSCSSSILEKCHYINKYLYRYYKQTPTMYVSVLLLNVAVVVIVVYSKDGFSFSIHKYTIHNIHLNNNTYRIGTRLLTYHVYLLCNFIHHCV